MIFAAEAGVFLFFLRVLLFFKLIIIGIVIYSVGPENAPMEVHRILLGAGIVLLEGIRLAAVSEGVYFLNAAPLNLSGADGSPCRAVLIATER